jgi:hypothetical protein
MNVAESGGAVIVPYFAAGPRQWHATRPGGGGAMSSLAGMEAAFMERGVVPAHKP